MCRGEFRSRTLFFMIVLFDFARKKKRVVSIKRMRLRENHIPDISIYVVQFTHEHQPGLGLHGIHPVSPI